MTTAVQRRALVLNQNYEPLNVCSVRRAFVLVFHGKAELLERGPDPIRAAELREYETPSVIRLNHYVKRPLPRPRLTRREVFARDRQRCQYCGRRGGDLTLDHVLPKHRGGAHDWANLVAACRSCNHRKGGRTPKEAKMRLLTHPATPIASAADLFARYLDRYNEWSPFLMGWMRRRRPAAVASEGVAAG